MKIEKGKVKSGSEGGECPRREEAQRSYTSPSDEMRTSEKSRFRKSITPDQGKVDATALAE